MALLHCDFFSEVLELRTSMTVILPEVARPTGHPTLYLLHGLSDDDTAWVRGTSIERYAETLGLAVVMPQVQRSFYCDMAYGNRYWTFLSEELPTLAHGFFRLSDRREDTFVAGLSMGGYGAMKWALRQPERFAAAASLSGALDMVARQQPDDLHARLMEQVFADRPVAGTPDDLHWLLDTATPADLPALYLCCGTEDHLLEETANFRDRAERNGIESTVDLGPGDHEWAYWDAKISEILQWLPLPAQLTVSPG